MNDHVTEDELILHFYGETAGDAPRIDSHLAGCGECQENWTSLRHTMQMVDSAEFADAPAGFERVMWARLQPHVAEFTPQRSAKSSWWSPRVWAPIAGLAAVITVAFLGGRLWNRTAQPAIPAATSDAADARATRERVLLSALGDHFEQTANLLVELKNTPDVKHVDLSFEQEQARNLVDNGRLYRETAKLNGDLELASVLEDLERVLVDVASSPEQLNTKDMKSLRARIEDDSLLFKVRALTATVREREKTLSTPVAKRTL
jgi:hypothetical protein